VLSDVLSTLGCTSRLVPDWEECLQQLGAGPPTHRFLFIDPTTPHFDEHRSRGRILSDPHLKATRIILIRRDPDDEFSHLENILDVDGMIARTYGTYEVSFIMNHFLCPQALNRRRHCRALVQVEARTRREGTTRHQPLTTGDLSAAGTFLKSSRPPKIGTPLEMEIAIPEIRRTILCQGDVVYRREAGNPEDRWMYPAGMGVCFSGINTSDRARLADYLSLRFLRYQRRATDRSLQTGC
jgi:hypothetical protein